MVAIKKRWLLSGVYHFTCNGVCYQENVSVEAYAFSEADVLHFGLRFVRAHIKRDYPHISEVRNLCWVSSEVVPVKGGEV